MKSILNNISEKSGLTKTEIKTSLFVIIFFVIGGFVKFAKVHFDTKEIKQFNYSFHDSLYKALTDKIQTNAFKKKEKRVDSEVELSDFSKGKIEYNQKGEVNPEQLSININTANIETLKKIPGIGPTIAKNIVELRKIKGTFKRIDDLIEVKRIGSKKLDKIRKYIYLEK